LRGAELVLRTAHELELDPIVHVSSHAALLPSAGPLTPNSEIGDPKGAYAQSKSETERIARGLQDAGGPVTIVYPGMVWGPDDPHVGESASLARDILRNRAPVSVAGGVPVVDVRDLAARGPRRYLATGEFLSLAGVPDAVRAATGRLLPAAQAPARLALAAAAGADVMQRVLPFRLPLGFQATWIAVNAVSGDDTAAREELASRSGRPRRRSPTRSAGSTRRATSPLAERDAPRRAVEPGADHAAPALDLLAGLSTTSAARRRSARRDAEQLALRSSAT
jgi:dihydroflavonol-4-reductase